MLFTTNGWERLKTVLFAGNHCWIKNMGGTDMTTGKQWTDPDGDTLEVSSNWSFGEAAITLYIDNHEDGHVGIRLTLQQASELVGVLGRLVSEGVRETVKRQMETKPRLTEGGKETLMAWNAACDQYRADIAATKASDVKNHVDPLARLEQERLVQTVHEKRHREFVDGG